MADHVVTIKADGQGGCTIEPDPFEAGRNHSVKFELVGEPGGFVDFGAESPFGEADEDKRFRPGENRDKKVKSNARSKPFQYRYRVSWPGGQGNGSGEIIP